MLRVYPLPRSFLKSLNTTVCSARISWASSKKSWRKRANVARDDVGCASDSFAQELTLHLQERPLASAQVPRYLILPSFKAVDKYYVGVELEGADVCGSADFPRKSHAALVIDIGLRWVRMIDRRTTDQ
jgi:hypothetical protein